MDGMIPMEPRNDTYVPDAWSRSPVALCPRCHTPMEKFDGADVKERNYRGLLCPKCHWFKGTRSLGYGMRRVGPKSDGRYDEPFEGRIRPRRR
ncbi:MAG: hypothetical protein QXD84_00205 [Thermoplasmata archaeon]